MGVDFLQKARSQVVPFQEVAEVQDGGLVGQGAGQLQSHEPPDRAGLVEQILHAGVAEVVEELDAVGPEHDRQRVGMTSPVGLGVAGADAVLQVLPGNQGVHALKKELAARLALLSLAVQQL